MPDTNLPEDPEQESAFSDHRRPAYRHAAAWRPRPDSAPDPTMRRLAFAAVGVSVLVVGGVGLLARRHAPPSVPVIAPSPIPLRVKPQDPGGMQVAGADDAVLNATGGNEQDTIAPPPEAPAPQALARAEAGAVPVPAPAPSSQPPSVAPPSVAPASEAPPSVAPASTPAVAPNPAPAAAAESPPPGAGASVQLAALPSADAAAAEWRRLQHRAPALLGARQPAILRAERAGQVFYRLRLGGFADIAAATRFCQQARAAGLACTLADF